MDKENPKKSEIAPAATDSNKEPTATGTVFKGDFDLLMARVGSGDQQACRELAERYTPHILRVVRTWLPDSMRRRFDSQDFTQTIWRAVFRNRDKIGRFNSPQHLVAYLMVAARNRVKFECRKQFGSQARDLNRELELESQNIPPVQSEADDNDDLAGRFTATELISRDETPSQIAIGKETVQDFLQSLDSETKQIVLLSRRGLTFSEIAEQVPFPCSAKTVQRTIHEVWEKLNGRKP